jgi:RNA polymerase sigma-70 factor (family 1)
MSAIYYSYGDVMLLQLLAKDDYDAFTEIYNRYWEKLLFVAGTKCRNLAAAEEIVQDIFTELWNRRQQLNITNTLEGYLAASVKYRVINFQAKLKRALDYQAFASTSLTPYENTTEQQLNFNELKRRVEQLVSKLPDKCRITYQLSKEDGLSQKEIASRLGISEKGVEANLSRAMKSLRLQLKNFFFF